MKTKTQFKHVAKTLCFIGLALSACSKDESPTPPPPGGDGDGQIVKTDGINPSELNAYKGDIGLVFEVRNLVKKGYRPAKATVTVNATEGDYSQTLEFDPYTYMGQLKIPLEALNNSAKSELTDGVEVIITLMDAGGNLIWEETFTKISFQANPGPLLIMGNGLPDLITEVYLKANTPYYIQIIQEGEPVKEATGRNSKPTAFGHITQTSNVAFTGDEASLLFTFEALPGFINTYAIRHLQSGKYLRINRNYTGFPGNNLFPVTHQAIVADLDWQFPDDFLAGNTDARFKVAKVADGIYRLESVSGEKVMVASGVGYTLNYPGATEVLMRFVPMNIDWSIETIGTSYLEPILPPAKTGFGFNNTLVNCGSGPLQQTVGVEVSETVTATTGWEESVSVISSHTASVSTTVGVEVSASFFGNGATYSAEVTGGYEYTTSNTTENSNWGEISTETTEFYFSQRTVTVPPKSASLVYDAIQFYDNIKVNFVQRLRVRAKEHDTGEALSGEEISTQFHFNGFNGVITETGGDFIEITLRGVALLDKVIKSTSDVQEVNPMCSN